MKIEIFREPCWLLEAAELVYSMVNRLPAEKLTAEGTYCIPADAVEKLRQEACDGLNPEDKALQYYFQGVPVDGVPERLSCPGCCILYQSLELGHPEPEDMVQALSQNWRHTQETNCTVSGIGGFSIGFEPNPQESFSSLAESMEKLPVPSAYQMRLLEVYSAYDLHLNRVLALLLPVCRKLKALLVPWVARAKPLIDQWEDFFETHTPQEFLRNRARCDAERYQTLKLAMRYFSPDLCPGVTVDTDRSVRCMLGLSRRVDLHRNTSPHPEEWELTALRLVMNPARLEMLRAMEERPMAVQELAQLLNLNVGSVSRDINSMRNARLLLADYSGSRSFYRTNLPEIEKMAQHILDYLRNAASGQ
ncbi:MAG: ArsR/SmtB family transcription factor [Faecousia sp.]